MANSIVLKLTFLAFACMLVTAPSAEASITCGQVYSSLVSCMPYLRGGGTVPTNCCAGVRSLSEAARTTPDRQSVCICLKQAAAGYIGVNPRPAMALPGKCRVSVGYPISATVDCSKVK